MAGTRYAVANPDVVITRPLLERGRDMTAACLAPLVMPPMVRPGVEFQLVANAVTASRQPGDPVILMLGAHPIKLGLSRFIVDLIERRWGTHIATNGAGIIHDFELALVA